MACNVIFVRHGQSEGNLLRVFLGHTDRNLTEFGEEQAKKTAEFLKDRKIDKIYSSDLKRAFNTAKPLADLKGIDIIKTEGLREIFAGYWENIPINDIKEKYAESYNTWMNNIGRARHEGGESVIELQERIKNEVLRIVSENDNKTIAIFTHATPIRTFFSYINGKNIDEIKNLPWPTNASVSEAVFLDNGEIKELYYARDDFLGNIISYVPKDL